MAFNVAAMAAVLVIGLCSGGVLTMLAEARKRSFSAGSRKGRAKH